jgi:hypothetical protein
MIARACLAASLVLAAFTAHAYVLDFGNGPNAPTICSSNVDGSGAFQSCSDFGRLNQAYGDVAGVADVTYSEPRFTAGLRSMEWWASNYNDLYGVGFAESNDADSYARITLAALSGPLVLTHFDLGAYADTTRPTHVEVRDLGTNALLFSYAGNVGSASPDVPTSFDFHLPSASGFQIDFYDSAWNVGIDNITFGTLAAIPEPETYALLVSGFGLLGFVARRKQRALR